MDPLSLAQNALEAALKNSAGLKRAMGAAIANVVAFNKTRGTEGHDVNSEKDLPEIRLEPIGGPCNINWTSSHTTVEWSVRLVVNTADLRLTKVLAPVLFSVYAALAATIREPALRQMTWGGHQFLRNVSIAAITVGVNEFLLNRGIAGWSAVADVTFHMDFPGPLLAAWHNGTLED